MLRIGPDPSNNHVSAINVREDNKRIGIHKNPSGKYIFDISGSLNCKSLYVNDLHYQPGDAMWNVDNSNVSYTSGSVGIGTTTPTQTLDVSGDALFNSRAFVGKWSANSLWSVFCNGANNNTVSDYALIQSNLGDVKVNSSSSRKLRLSIANQNALTINGDKNVGIGTDDPTHLLEITGNTRTQGLTVGVDGTLMIESISSPSHGSETVILQTSIDNKTLNDSNRYTYGGIIPSRRLMCLQPYDGRVGIGTTSPGTTLDVSGIVQAGDAMIATWSADSIYAAFSHKGRNTLTGYALIQQNNGTTYLNSETGRALHLRIANNTKMIIASDGKVGIGTTSPASALHVAGAIDTTPNTGGVHMGMNSNDAALKLCDGASSSTGGTCYIDFTKATVTRRGRIQYAFADDSLRFQTATSATDVGSEKMRISSGGNVGIGTTSPTSTLHVGGETATFETVSQASGIKFIPSSYTPSSSTINDNVTFIGNTPITSKDYIDEINAHSDATVITQDHSHFQISAGNSKQRSIIITTGEGIRNIQGWNTQTIAGSNTHSPISLQALGGNVGIGTTSPGKTLDISSDTGTTLRVETTGAATNFTTCPIIALKTTSHEANINLNSNDGALRFSVNDTNRMFLLPSGNVGIGTTSPNDPLEVNGAIRAGNSGFKIGSNVMALFRTSNNVQLDVYDDFIIKTGPVTVGGEPGAVDSMIIKNDGKVGIGTTSPLDTLDVAGSIRLGSWQDTTRFIGFTQPAATTMIAGIELESVEIDSGDQYSQNLHFRTHNHGVTHGRRMTIDYRGNVGIGTTSPSSSLHVAGAIDSTPSGAGIHMGLLSNQATIALVPLHAASTGDITFCPNNSSNVGRIRYNFDDNFLQFRVNSVDRMHIDSAGNVGIGTDNPTEKLHVDGNIQLGIANTIKATNATSLTIQACGNTDGEGLILKNQYTSTNGSLGHLHNIKIGRFSVGGIEFNTANTTRMVINSSGNVGIGTTSPSSSLHIAGHSATFETVAQASGIKFIPSSYVNGSNLTQNDNVAFIANIPMTNSEYISEINDHSDFQTTAATSGFGHFQLAAGDSKQRSIIFSAGRIGSYNFYNIQAWAAEAKIANNLSLQALGGNVGIGTTSPAQKLHVTQGDIQINNGKIFGTIDNYSRNGSTADNDMLVFNAHTSGAASFGSAKIVLRRDLGNFYGAEILGGLPNGSTSSPIDLEGSERFAINTVGNGTRTRTLSILSSGNVGIGTTSPSDKFHVNGVARATSFTSTSDDRVKHNETPLTNSLGLISQLRPKRYLKTQQMYDASLNITIDASGNYTDISENDVVTEEIGIIAQDVLSIDDLSFLVKPSLDPSGNETGPMGLDYQSLFVLSIQAIQEQQTMIQQLTSRIETIERQQTDS